MLYRQDGGRRQGIPSWSRARWLSSAAGRPPAVPRLCGRTSAHAPNSATRSRSGAFIGRCTTSTGSTTSLLTLWSMKRWTSRTAVARVVPGDRAHTARCSNGPGACRAGRMVRVAVAARAVFQFPRLWSAAFQIQRFWNAAARLGSVMAGARRSLPRTSWSRAYPPRRQGGGFCLSEKWTSAIL